MIKAALRLVAFFTLTLTLIPVQALALMTSKKLSARIPIFYHSTCLKIFDITVSVSGTPSTKTPCLLVCNHTSYLDMPVIGSLLPVSFVARSEVAHWPLFGWLARLQRSVFIERRRSKAAEGSSTLLARLTPGSYIVLFPEGTTSDGSRVLPFRRPLFQSVLDCAGDVAVQPISLVCSGAEGLPADRLARQAFAWYGDMELIPHLWQFCKVRRTRVQIIFHPPLDLSACTDRLSMARCAENAIAQGIEDFQRTL